MIIRSESDLATSLGKLAANGPLLSVVPVPGLGYSASTSGIAPLRSGLSAEQSEVFDSVSNDSDDDILVLAGPGSGKTKTLVASIAHAVANGTSPDSIVAISFTNNSAAELKVRLTKVAEQYSLPALNRVHVSTFHAWVSQMEAMTVTPWSFPPIGLKTASFALALDLKNPNSVLHTFSKAEVAAAERHLEDCESFDAMEEREFNRIGKPGSTEANRTGFNNLKTATAELEPDMADTQIGSFGTIMKSGAALAAGLKPGEISWLFIDEAQDLNAPQAAMVAALQKSTQCRVFAIADDDQGIYKFRGASSQFLREFESKTSTLSFQLTRNFRSTQPIVQACVNWITPNWNELERTPKALTSDRPGLPVVLLTASYDDARGRHAKIIIDACRNAGLVNAYGEVAALGLSPSTMAYDLKESEIPINALADFSLPDEILKTWLHLLKSTTLTGDWHHTLWADFLETATAKQKAKGDTALGHPGLNDLYAALEVVRRLEPALPPKTLADLIPKILEQHSTKVTPFTFTGGKPDPEYKGDKINYISFHSSKGMEFPVVWVTGGAFTLSVSDKEIHEGQPNVQTELPFLTDSTNDDSFIEDDQTLDEKNKRAALLEKRRLLYVAMSRASDLLLVSAPLSRKANETAFKSATDKMLNDVDHKVIYTDAQAKDFAATILATHRNPHWTPPHRYRVESFSSLTGQAMPGELREVEIPKEREFPVPQSPERVTGDLFHRVMHLLTLKPGLIDQRLAGTIGNAALMARVSKLPPAELTALNALLTSYFADSVNRACPKRCWFFISRFFRCSNYQF